MRTPSSALPAWPHGFVLGRGRPWPLAAFAAAFFGLNFTTFREILLADFFATALVLAAFLRVAIVSSPVVFRGSSEAASLYFLPSLLCGLRLPMRPLSLPAA